MTRLILATFQLLPAGETGGDALIGALAARGIDAEWAVWDDPSVDWSAADLVAVRSTWDYYRRAPEFLAWARAVEKETPLLNGADVFAWNADKAYLRELAAADLPVVPTELADDATLVPVLADTTGRWGSVVVKPRTGAGGVGVCVVDSVSDGRLEGLVAAPWVVQPLVASVRTHGETSVYVFRGGSGGRAAAQVDKLPADAGSEIRVHELYGGRSRPVPLDPDAAAVAERAVVVAEGITGGSLTYGRVDLLRYDGRLVVSELELIEPGLYLDVDPANAERFAAAVRTAVDGL